MRSWARSRSRRRLVAAVLAGMPVLGSPGTASAQPGERASPAGWQVQVVPAPQKVLTRRGPVTRTVTHLVPLASAPFPYEGLVPRANRPFVEVAEDGRRFHRTSRGRVLWIDESFADPRVLLHIPKGFDARRPAMIVVYFHGHGANLSDDVYARQRVALQVSRSGLNAVLIAPQLAVNTADSSPGKLWEPGGLARLIGEAGTHLAELYGDRRADAAFTDLPVVLVAYSGGFMPAAWSIRHGGLGRRIKGVVMFDAMYGELDVFADWIAANRSGFFVSAYTDSTRPGNDKLQGLLAERAIPTGGALDGQLAPGAVIFLPGAEDATHRDFLTRAWRDLPLQDALSRVRGYPRS